MRHTAWLVAMTSILSTTLASAGDDDEVTPEMQRLDLSIPDIPALIDLGISAEKVSRPQTSRDLAVSLANGFSVDGSFHDGVAIEAAPFALANLFDGAVDSLRLSFATAAVQADDMTNGKLAVGLRYTAGTYDPKQDTKLKQCLQHWLPKSVHQVPGGGAGAGGAAVDLPDAGFAKGRDPKVMEGLQTCRDRARVAHLAQTALELAAVADGTAVDSLKVEDLGTPHASFWASFGWGFNSWNVSDYENPETAMPKRPFGVQPTLMARLDVTDAEDVTTEALFAGLRVPIVWDAFGLFGEYGLTVGDLGDKTMTGRTISHRVGGGFDYRVTSGGWLGVYVGDDLGDGATGFSVLSNIKFSYGEERKYGL